ncbi:MAG TPA: DMT family transporter [Terriglobales bacterium]|nr:DMT family transporter [Terriglobales bacterium]
MTRSASTNSSAETRAPGGLEADGERHPIRGYLAIAGAGLFWGVSATLGKAVFTGQLLAHPLSPLDPLILTQTRTTISFLVLAPIVLLRGGRGALAMPAQDVLRCMLLGTLGIAASNYFYYLAIEKTTVATAIVLQYTAPVWVLLYMVARRQQRATLQRVAAVGAAVAGSALAIGVGGPAELRLNALGITAAHLAALAFAFYNVYGHSLLQRYERWRVVVYAFLGAALFWMILNPPWKVVAAHYSRDQWIFLVFFAFTSVLIPFSLYFTGLRYLDATRAIVTSCLEPVFAILLAAAFVGESLHGLQLVGIVMVLVATITVQRHGDNNRRRS